MPKKVKEEELDLESTEIKPRVKSYAARWLEDNCPDNREEILKICELTARSAERQFTFGPASGDNYEAFALIFFATFQSILEFLREKQRRYLVYSIEIGKSIKIGYSNSTAEENEKLGNFMPRMEYIGINHDITGKASPVEVNATTNNFIQWKVLNIKKNDEQANDIQEIAYNRIFNEYYIDLRTSEATIPLFCIFMDNIVNVLRAMAKEAQGTNVTEFTIRVLGLFDAFYSYDEMEGKERIEFTALPYMKLSLKNDNLAGNQ